jgi:GH15 family glucan-1,4-alpha-glucosidase
MACGRDQRRRRTDLTETARSMSYQPIENYGVIGDLHTVALVGMNGSIDFFCFPRFDSPTVFAALLDESKGGRFLIAPILCDVHHKQLYLPDTNILLTRFLADTGVAEITDFMPVVEGRGLRHGIVRRVRTVRGSVRFRMICAPRFDYGRARHRTERHGGAVVFTVPRLERATLRLRTQVPVTIENGAAVAEFTLRAGESADFILGEARPGVPAMSSPGRWCDRAFQQTSDFWHAWADGSSYHGRWREMVQRSALTLKLLTSRPYGSIVAAATFGLPERIGGERNWDYRYTWIRDSSFTLYALLRLGYTSEASAFMRWIEARCREAKTDGLLQVLYGIDGRRDLGEQVLRQFEGYRASSPVRIGNGAATQLQLDIYGELMDSVYLHDKYASPVSYDLWRDLIRMVDWVCEHWHDKDQGIWEVRGGQQHFLYSRLMCWVAVDRAVRLSWKRSLPAPLERWLPVRNQIYNSIFTDLFHPRRQAFVQCAGSESMDAACLLMPLMRFIGPTDPRWLSTLAAVEQELVNDSLVLRYKTDSAAPDGLHGSEGAFTMCSFWYVECLSRAGRLEKARLLLEKMLAFANHLGLYSEQLGPSGEHLGNFPQAFTHLGLISAVYDLDRQLSAAGWHA